MRDALHDDLAAAYDDGAVGDFERVADVVVGNQHADAALGKKAQIKGVYFSENWNNH